MSTLSKQHGMTLREACALAVAILGDRATTTEIYGFLAGDGWHTTRMTVKATLRDLRGALVEVAEHGEPRYGRPTRWRLTEAGRAWIAAPVLPGEKVAGWGCGAREDGS